MEQMVEFLMGFTGITPYLVVFSILLACGLGLPIPEDVTLFAAGLLSYFGNANVFVMIVVSFFGVMIGDSIIFLLGAKFGPQLTRRWIFARILHTERMAEIESRFQRWGNKLIFMARFMPGLRAPVFFSSGTLGLPFRVFFFYDGMAALLSVPAIVYSVYHFGDDIEKVIGVIRSVQNGILLVIAAIIIVVALRWALRRRRQKRLVALAGQITPAGSNTEPSADARTGVQG